MPTPTAVGTVTFEEIGGPTVTTDRNGVVTVRRIRRGKTTGATKALADAALKTEMDLHVIGAADVLHPLALLENAQGGKSGNFSTVTLSYRGGLSAYVEMYDSPQLAQKEDATWTLRRRFIGPISALDSFLAAYPKGSYDTTYLNVSLQTKSGREDGPALAIAELNYEGAIYDAPDGSDSSQRQVIRNYLRSSVTFSPWSQGGFQTGPRVVGTYYSETVTVNYSTTSEPSSPQYSSLLSDGSNTFIFEWSPSSFDPTCAPHNLEKRKIVTNFHTETAPGSDIVRVSETHQWVITEGSASYDPG